jgi:hypothetical protein
VGGAPAKYRRPISPKAAVISMSRDSDEEFELVRRIVETTKRYTDSLAVLDWAKSFDINSVLKELLELLYILPVGTKHLSRYFGLPYDPITPTSF